MVHTANPITAAAGELFGEVVVGMGEALVGNLPGRALSFSASSSSCSSNKNAASAAAVKLLSLPSKRVGLFSDPDASNLIARSDSNGEDLEAFAGAGTHLLVEPCLRLSVKCAPYAKSSAGCTIDGASSRWKDKGTCAGKLADKATMRQSLKAVDATYAGMAVACSDSEYNGL